MSTVDEIQKLRKENEVLQARVAQCLKAGEGYRSVLDRMEIPKGSTNEFMVMFPVFDAAAERMAKGESERAAFLSVGLSINAMKAIAARHSALMMTVRKARHAGEVYRDAHGDQFKRGRPSTYTPVKGQLFVAAVRKGLAIIDAAKDIGVSSSAIILWRKQNVDFDRAVVTAIASRKTYNRRGIKPPQCVDTFDQELAALIVDDVAKGRSIVDICKAEDMPAASTVYRWMKRHGEFAIAIEQAKRRRS